MVTAAAILVIGPVLAYTRAGAETPLDRYRSLLEEKLALQRENRILARDAELAASPSPYILFNADSGILSFCVRGKTLKEYRFKAVSFKSWGRRPIAAEAIARAHEGPLTILEKEGGQQEIIPPSSDDPNGPAGIQPGSDPEEMDDAAKLGVKAPEDYYIKFEENVVFQVQSERERSLKDKAVDRLVEFGAAVRARLSDPWGSEDDSPMTLYLLTDIETASHLYHSILPGERIFITPPPPPRIALVVSEGSS